jgi:L-fucose isomerase-like protein
MIKKDHVIGYCAVGNPIGYPKEILDKIRSEGAATLRMKGPKIVEFPGFLTTASDAISAVQLFKKEMVDIVVFNFASWGEGGSVLRVVRLLGPTPIILWAFGNYYENLTLTGMLEATSNLTKTGSMFSYVFGPPSRPATQSDLFRSVDALCLINELQCSNFGLVGLNCPGMVDSTTDEISLRRRIGCELVHLDLSEVFSTCKEISDREVVGHAANLKSWASSIGTGEKDIFESVRLYYALKKIVNKYHLAGFTIRCWPELKGNLSGYQMTPCYGMAKLADEGVVAACEADVSGTITMFMLQELSRKPAVCLDYNTVNFDRNTITLWHCGSNALSLAGEGATTYLGKPSEGGARETGSGMGVEFSLADGDATVAKLTREYDRMLIACAKIVPPMPRFRGGIAEVAFDEPVVSFLSRAVEEGFEHHICVAYGDVSHELQEVCKRMQITPIMG